MSWNDPQGRPHRGNGAGRPASTSPILKAATVAMRGADPHAMPIDRLVADADGAGYRRGYEEGWNAGALAAGGQLADGAGRVAACLSAGLARIEAAARSRRREDASQIVALALTVAEWAVRRELSSVPGAFFGRLEEILADRERDATVEIATSPGLVEATRSWVDDPAVRVTAAADLADGEARVSLSDTTVFSTFADAFERAREVLDALAGAPVGEHDDDEDGDDEDGDGGEEEVVEVLYDVSAEVVR